MLTQRYALYIILAGLTLVGVAVGFTIATGFSLLFVLIGFNGLLVTGGGVWMYQVGKHSV